MAQNLAGVQHLGVHWHTRFLHRHPTLTVKFSRVLENKRGHVEQPSIIVDYFQKYQELQRRYKFTNDRIFNVDEKGFMKGFASQGKIIIPIAYKNRKFKLQDGSRESITMIETISM